MKKFYAFLIAALGCVAANAQSFGFENEGVKLADDDLVTVYATEENYGDEEEPWWMVECVPNVKVVNYSDKTLTIGGTATVDNPGFMQWCYGGACVQFGSNTTLSQTKEIPAGDYAALMLEPQYQYGNYQERNATVTLSAGSETHTIKLKYVYNETSGIYNSTLQQNDKTVYNLAGQRVNKAERGVYVVGGKKMLR